MHLPHQPGPKGLTALLRVHLLPQDILRMIEQYLSEEGFLATKLVLHDEANLQAKERSERQAHGKALKRAILGELEKAT